MPSKGSPRVILRVPAQVLAEMDAQIADTAQTRRKAPHTRTSFILEAILEKIDKRARHRRAAEKKKAGRGPGL